MLRTTTSIACALLLSLASSPLAAEGTLRGSRSSMIRQNQVAKELDFTFLRTPGQVERFVEEGHLVEVEGNADYELANVSYPFARPALRTFVERLSAQYREGCGEKLVVTSLTRPRSLQPRNAHDLSVHPAGMAVDLRVSQSAACRTWLEATLLSLEGDELLDVTRESRPPHYHVAVFPEAYLARVEQIVGDSLRAAENAARFAEAMRSADALALRQTIGHDPMAAAMVPAGRDADGAPTIWLPLAVVVMMGASLVDRFRRSRRSESDEA